MAQPLENGDDKKSEKSVLTFKKAHRRAQSMPSQHIGKQSQRSTRNQEYDKTQESTVSGNKAAHRHILIPASNKKSYRQNHPNFDAIEVMEEEKDFEVPINEEEMMRFQGIDHSEGEEANIDVHKRHKRFWQLNWKGVHFTGLPAWLQGCVAFTGAFVWLLSRPTNVISWPDKLIFSAFFVGAILCMGLSFSFHTVQCHSENVGRLFSKFIRPVDLLCFLLPSIRHVFLHWHDCCIGNSCSGRLSLGQIRSAKIQASSWGRFLSHGTEHHGILEIAMKRLEGGSCSEQLIEHSGTDKADIQWIDEQLRPY
uniref:Pecanex-like protein n=1 Tax=Meloidogyne hapla TaxID=6305 RepID=A0A1I8BJ01_MELHA